MSVITNDALRQLLDRALMSEKGIAIADLSFKTAKSLRFRIYTIRKRDREASLKTYAPGDALYGKSSWDELEVIIEPMEKVALDDLEISPDLDRREPDPTTPSRLIIRKTQLPALHIVDLDTGEDLS